MHKGAPPLDGEIRVNLHHIFDASNTVVHV